MSVMAIRQALYLLCWKLYGLVFPGRWLFLSYDGMKLTDGGGNQALRITAIKAVSTLFGIGYSHTPISHIDNHGVAALAGDPIEPTRLAAWNSLAAFRSTKVILPSALVVPIDHLRLAHLFLYRRLSATRKKAVVLSITNPFPVSDYFPTAYTLVRSNVEQSRSRSPFRVALHVRRGDLMWTHSERLLPVSYYLNVALRIAKTLQSLNVQYVCELYSEELTKSLTLQRSLPS